MTFKKKKNHKTVFIIFGLLNTTIITIIMWFMKTTNLWIVISYYKCYIFIALLVYSYKPHYHIDIVGITLYLVFSLFLSKFGTSVLYLELFYLKNYVWTIRYNNFANAWKISYYILKIIILGFVIVWTL